VGKHRLASTTHTLELRQIAELNVLLQRGGVAFEGGTLCLLVAQGPPSYPYVFAQVDGAGGSRLVELHGAELRILSAHFHLPHHWD